ncbi:MAG: transcription elongation factor GreA [Spirochaetia bacterium]
MAEGIVKNIQEQLNEEKWTRATLNSYTISNFKELDEIINETFESDQEDEVKDICDEHLAHTKNSIIALYISGIIALSRQIVDDANLIRLIHIFMDNHKWKIVEFLCKRILDFGENRYALRTLAECYNNESQEDEMYEVWERLIRVDYEETEIVRHLAERKEEENDIEGAIEYYKKAIHRYINKKQFAAVKDIWAKLIEYCPEEIDFFYHIEAKIAKVLSEDRAAQLLTDLYPVYKEKKKWSTSVEILKKILEYDPKNTWARSEIVFCYRQMHADHSQLEEYIKLSNLNQNWRNVHDAIADFEKHISFDKGNFVYHRTWGIGRISSIEDDTIVVDFARKRGHEMSLKMAVSALTVLAKEHIWVLRSVLKKQKLHDKVKKNIAWALKMIIKSFDNEADMKRIKTELVPGVLTQGEWSSWSTEARKILKTNPAFGTHPEKPDKYMVRNKPMSFEEKLYNKFKAERNFFGRISTLQEFIGYKNADVDSEYFAEMFSYFTTFLKSYSTVNENIICSFLIVNKIVNIYPYLGRELNVNFRELFQQIKSVEDIFQKIENTELKKDFLALIRRNVASWPMFFIQLFPYYMSRYIIDTLKEGGKQEELKELVIRMYDNYREFREPFVWLVRNVQEEEWFQEINIPFEKLLICMIHLLDITFREINNRRDVSLNRKINKQIQTYLLKEDHLKNYIAQADEEAITRLYTLVSDIKDLDAALKIELRHTIIERFPDFKFLGEEEKESVSRRLLVTAESYERKQSELRHIHEVEVPENSKEISEALQHGDLRENAEYKAAKEKQDMLNNAAAKLKEEIEKAQIFDKKSIDTSKISFGTVAKLKNLDSGESEEYTLLGPWESNPNENIISYLSPLGNELWGHTQGEELEFVINERKFHYLIEKISQAKL